MITYVPSSHRLSRKLRNGTLTEEEDLDNLEDLDEEAACYQADLQAAVTSVVQQIEVDQWVIVLYEEQWYPGCVIEVIIYLLHISFNLIGKNL